MLQIYRSKWMKKIFQFIFSMAIIFSAELLWAKSPAVQHSASMKFTPREVIFFHPDGMSSIHWMFVRFMTVGPDGMMSWDKMEHQSLYRGHLLDSLSATSNAGATTHAYGKKAYYDSFGLNRKKSIVAASGFKGSILQEAQKKGYAVGLCQSGELVEPGSAVFAVSDKSRYNYFDIAKKLLYSNVDVILGGGEIFLLPKGVMGRFGEGAREDNLNLIKIAQTLGYKVVYNKAELMALPVNTLKVLGVFAYQHTFNDAPEENLKAEKKNLYKKKAPSIADMTEKAAQILRYKSRNKKGFFLVSEEEGTDNFSNYNNASGVLEAGKRADETIRRMRKFIKGRSNSLLLVASDSNASGLSLLGVPKRKLKRIFGSTSITPLVDKSTKASYDGVSGSESAYFWSHPDKKGRKHPFLVSWPTYRDVSGGVVVKASGLCANQLKNNMDNTEIYQILYSALFKECR